MTAERQGLEQGRGAHDGAQRELMSQLIPRVKPSESSGREKGLPCKA